MKTVYQLITITALVLCLAFQACAYEQVNEAIKAGQQKLQQKDYAGARKDAAAALQLVKTPAEKYTAVLFMGQISDSAKEFARARSEYAQVLGYDQATTAQKAEALNRIAGSWIGEKQFTKARNEYARALALPNLSPRDTANIRLNIARSFDRQQDWAAARNEYNKCLTFDKIPDYLRFNALCGIAANYGREKNLAAMVAAIDAVMKERGAAWSKYTLLRDCAALAREKNDLTQALNAWKQAIATQGLPQKNYGEAVFKASELLFEQGRTADAQQLIEKSIAEQQMAPNDCFQAKLIAAGLKAAGKAEGLQDEAAKAAEAFPPAELQPEAKLKAYNEAGKFFMHLRQYEVVREFIALADALYRPEPQKSYKCRFVDKAPSSVEGWLASPLLSNPKNLESRFEAYDRKAADLLIYDVRSERTATSAQGAADTETAFAMACDDNGWYIFVKRADSQVEKVSAGLLGGGQLEMYFTPAYGECYYQWLFSFPAGKLDPVEWTSPNPNHHPMEPYCKTDVAALDNGFGTSFFFPWEMLYDKLPKEGDSWLFGIINWTRAGGVSWGGKVHEIHKWGLVEWSGFTPDRVLSIKRKLVMKGFGNYQKTRNKLVAHWKDEMLGDPTFYQQALLPVVTKLDEYGKSVGDQMTPAQIETLFTQALPDWMEFNYTVSTLRQTYLQNALFNTVKR
jgi:tetratricopeptide (TPR) repeat protein